VRPINHARLSTTTRTFDQRSDLTPISVPDFDAAKFVSLLEQEGFTKNQSMVVLSALDDVVEERLVFHRDESIRRIVLIVYADS
jgi:nitrate reductase NapAB chaperone NapD